MIKTIQLKESEITHNWLLVDLKGKVLGHIATEIADLLRGKHKAIFTPQYDCGDYVVAINASEIVLNATKRDTKEYFRHTGFPGGLRTRFAAQVLDTHPDRVIVDAVKGMLPKNKLQKQFLNKFKVFTGPEHTHQGQNPQPFAL
ncbi:MAG: 50S ribosomal protein L13 [Patescibacteria group bacterium]